METATAKSFNIATGLLGELEHEIATTRKCLERIPENLFDYKPHEKSMTMGRLATHVVDDLHDGRARFCRRRLQTV
jgi:hypothetical protein